MFDKPGKPFNTDSDCTLDLPCTKCHPGLLYPARAPVKVHISFPSPDPMFDHLLELSHQDDSNKWSNIGFGEEITQARFKLILCILSGTLYTFTEMCFQKALISDND